VKSVRFHSIVTCLVCLLFVNNTSALASNLPLGNGNTPQEPSNKQVVPFGADGWQVENDNGHSRLLELSSLPAPYAATLVCPDHENIGLSEHEWVVVRAGCELSFRMSTQPARTRDGAVQLQIARASSEAIDKTEPSEYQELASRKGSFFVDLTLRSAPASASLHDQAGRGASEHGASPSLMSFATLQNALIALAILLTACLLILLLLYGLPKQFRSVLLGRSANLSPNKQQQQEAQSPTIARLRSISAQPLQKEEVRDQAVGAQSIEPKTQTNLLADLLHVVRNLEEADLQRKFELQNVLSQIRELLAIDRSETEEALGSQLSQIAVQSEATDQRLGCLEKALANLEANASSELKNLLAMLPALSSLQGGTGNDGRTQLTQKINEALESYIARSAPNAETLAPVSTKIQLIRSAVDKFWRETSALNSERSEAKLGPAVADLKRLHGEMESAVQLARVQRFGFVVDISTLPGSRQTLGDGIAAALQREIIKLENPAEYYSKRLDLVGCRVCSDSADLVDTQLDIDRRNSTLQGALQNLFAAAGFSDISPAQHDMFVGTEQSVVQIARRGPEDRAGTVARLLTRGLRLDGQVIRKASVILYQ